MPKSRLEWKVGLFVFIGLILAAVLLLQFSKGVSFFRPTYRILLHSQNVGGLKTGAMVLMSGVQVGTVSELRLAEDGKSVTITLRIHSQYPVHKDAKFVIEQSGFLGDQFVAILPTKNAAEKFPDGGEATAEAPFDLQEVARSAAGFIQRIDETARRLNDAIAEVRRLVLNGQTLTNLSASASNLRTVSERALTMVDNINSLVATNGPAIGQSASNLVAFSEQMNQFGSALSGVLATNTPEINAAVKNIESSTEVLKNLLNDVQAGKGLAGTVLENKQLSAHVAEIANNLSITSSNLNRLGLWGILWQHKPPKTNAPAQHPLSTPKSLSE
jgi:phospholipid/cholesterol/gamma-HCH transport system substrate-binding protein